MIARTERTFCLRTAWLVGAGVTVLGAVMFGGALGWWWAGAVIAVAIGGPALTLLAIASLRSRELISRAGQRVSYTCPKCGRSGRPAYMCGGCGTSHADLIPSVFGVLRARCGAATCEGVLPTCPATGRDRLRKACSRCATEIPHDATGSLPEYHIALVGAASSGKSNLLVTAVWHLKERFSPQNGFVLTFANADEEKQYDRLVELLKGGIAMQKTFGRLPALTIGLRSESGDGGCLLHLFDAAGEHFADDQSLREHPIEQADAIILMVDPFAEEAIHRGALGDLDGLAVGHANAAVDGVQNIANRLVNVLEQKLASPDRRFHIPVAVVVTKVDVVGLGDRYHIGRTDLGRAFPSFAMAVDRAERETPRVLRLLHDLGLGNLVQMLDTRFGAVGYFAVSPLGRSLADSPGRPFEPQGVLPPLVWLCGTMNALGDTDPVNVFLTNTHLYAVRCLRGLEGEGTRQASWALLWGAAGVGLLVTLFLPGPLRLLYAIVVVPLVLLYISLVYILVYRRVTEDG